MRDHANLVSLWRILPPVITVLAAAASIGSARETDVYWHIKMGQDIIDNQRLTGDPGWIYGPGDSNWVTTQWLSEVVLYFAYQLGGWAGIAGLRAVLAVAFFVSLFIVIRKALPRSLSEDEKARIQSILGGVALLATPILIQERPQTVSFIILLWVGLWLTRLLYTGKWPAWWLVGITALVWSWFHGAVLLLAPLLLAAFLFRLAVLRPQDAWYSFVTRGLPAIAIALAAPLVSPIGWRFYEQAFYIQQAARGIIVEWGPASLSDLSTLIWLGMVIIWALSALAMRKFGRRVNRIVVLEAAWMGLLLALSITAARYVLIAIVLSVPIVARRLAVALRHREPKTNIPSNWGKAVVLLSTLMLTITLATALPSTTPVPETESPTRIWSGLSQSSGDRRVLVDYNLSGKTMMLTNQNVKVSIDGRSDRYRDYIEEYRNMMLGESGWRETFTVDYGASTDALVEEASPLAEFLRNDGWGLVCADKGFVWLTAPGYYGRCSSPVGK